jgi:hypothetical protein
MSKHTPGPWGIDEGMSVWIMAGPLHVATIPRAADGDWSPANARLMAAAPEMLEALKQIAGALEDWASIPPPRDNTGEERALVVAAALARAVAAKAEGEEA